MIVCAGVFVTPVLAAPESVPDAFSVDDLRTIETERDKALKRLEKLEKSGKKADRELSQIDSDLISAAADSRRHEEAAIKAEARLETLSAEEISAREELLEDEEALEDVLATLMTFGARRPPALAVSPNDAGDAVRAAILMGDITPKLALRAEELAEEIDKIAELQLQIREEREDLKRTDLALKARRQEIEALYEEKNLRRLELAAEAERLKAETDKLAEDADSLKELLASISNAAPQRPRLKPPPPQIAKVGLRKPKEKLPPRAATHFTGKALPPVTGELLIGFGDPDLSRTPHKGQTWRTRAAAQVISPQDGRIKYAGDFRSYGQILIIDAGDGYLVVLAGLGALYGQTGQSVLAGEPIGRMSDSANRQPELYIEVRQDGELVDPATWLGRNA